MLNHITIMGRLTRDPELRTTQNGNAVASFSVAVERDKEVNGQRPVDFIDAVAWKQGAEFVSKYFHKGDMICVSGRLESRKWVDRDGQNRISWEVQAERCYFAGAKRQEGQLTDPPQQYRTQRAPDVYADDYEGPQPYSQLGYGYGQGNPFGTDGGDQGDFLGDGELPF